MVDTCLIQGLVCWRLGADETAREMFCEARRLSAGGFLASIRCRFAASCPRLWWYGRALRARLRGLHNRAPDRLRKG